MEADINYINENYFEEFLNEGAWSKSLLKFKVMLAWKYIVSIEL